MDAPASTSLLLGLFGLGGGEIILALALLLILFGSNKLRDIARSFGSRGLGAGMGVEKFGNVGRSQTETLDSKSDFDELERVFDQKPPLTTEQESRLSKALIVLFSQGFGVGKIPFAPGTFGSAVGLLWFALLISTENFWFYLAGTILGLALSIWLCGAAEKILKQPDPPSVVLDEIAAVPVCFIVWMGHAWFNHHALPSPASMFSAPNVVFALIIFVLFRIFDIAKPWPVRQSQRLPGGWGVTVDDLLAAVYVALISLLLVSKADPAA